MKGKVFGILGSMALMGALLASCEQAPKFEQPTLEARKVQIIEKNGYQFKDLNKNGKLDVYEDWRQPMQDRIDDLVSQMTLEEKVGLMFHPNIAVPADGKVVYDSQAELSQEAYAGPIGPGGNNQGAMGQGQVRRGADVKTYIEERNFRNILNNGIAEPKLFAQWSNAMQEYAEASRLGIPIMFSTDPRHGATLGAHVSGKQYFSQWPSKEGQVGITAARDRDIVKKFGEAVAEEYRAVGLHMILGPQIDVITEPRWSRNMGCFSEDADLTIEMMEAFMEGAQGDNVGPEKVLVHLKHWPGANPHQGGKGDFTVYPGNNVDYHLKPFKAGIAKGALAIMGYYSGTYVDTLNVNYSPYWSTEVLYNQLGFKGAICTDWGVVARTGPLNPRLAGKTTLKDNMEMVINAGVDQMGSETETSLVVELVKEGRVSEARVNQAASRILQWHFILGLFEDPYVDPEKAPQVCQREDLQKNAFQAQLESNILLVNEGNTLPAKEGIKLYVEGIDTEIAKNYGTLVDRPAQADLILVRTGVTAPTTGGGFGAMANMTPAQRAAMQRQREIEAAKPVDISLPASIWNNIKKLSATGKPVVVAFNPSGTSIVLPQDLKKVVKGCFLVFDCLDNALLDCVFGKFNPVGKLPFEIPATMKDVEAQLEDVPFDAPNKAFEFGFGLSY
ncbi:MAG: glycoside hydrolase family 3 C-terminal domain-containing protein [Bacteroidaceae bacterium]|nr:glycoside hydrolase family 3 C-terminal domain-containing protein [Bacteroidaceae bacterium]